MIDRTPDAPAADAMRPAPATDWHGHDGGWGCESALPFLWRQPRVALVADEQGHGAAGAAAVPDAAV